MLKYVSAALSCGHCYSHKSLPFNFNWAFLCHCLFVDQVMRPSKGSKIPLTSDFWLILRFISYHVFHVCLLGFNGPLVFLICISVENFSEN